MGFVIGGVVAWFIVSMFYGHLLPVLCWQTAITIVVGGIIGTVLEGVFSGKKYGEKP